MAMFKRSKRGPASRNKAAEQVSEEEDRQREDMEENVQLENSLSEESSSESDEDTNGLETDQPKALSRPNKVMILASRGINARQRHLMDDLCLLMPHFKKESKFDTKKELFRLNELAELNGCGHTVFFESRKPQELFMWLSKCPSGPSVRFHAQNIYTLDELHFTGNCMKNTRAILSFDPYFSSTAEGEVMKDLLSSVFGVPPNHKKTRSYIDHMIHFGWSDDRIWIRNYQVKEGGSTVELSETTTTLEGLSVSEIGPRLILHPIMVNDGSFVGRTTWRNPHYVPMGQLRAAAKQGLAVKHKQRAVLHAASVVRKQNAVLAENELDHVFD